MSDASDFTGVTAGSTTLLSHGSVAGTPAGGGNYTFSIPLAGVPQTTRSLLMLWNVASVAGGAQTSASNLKVIGSTSLTEWENLSVLRNYAGQSVAAPGDAMQPVYVPFYGLVDASGSLTFSATNNPTFNYWILALPDADLAGTAIDPTQVTNTTTFVGGAAQPLVVATQSGATVEVTQATAANLNATVTPAAASTFTVAPASGTALDVTQKVTTSSSGGILTTTAAYQRLVQPPAAGNVRIVDTVTPHATSAAGSLVFSFDGTNDNHAIDVIANTATAVNQPVNVGWKFLSTSSGLYVKQTVGTGGCSVTYHDIPA